jgi:hypothetical protein
LEHQPHAGVNVSAARPIGRFSGVHQWPVLSVHRGLAAKGIGKGAFKLGSHTWNATRKWYGQTRGLNAGTPVHHWLVEQGSALGKLVPDAIKNQPRNLMPMASQAFHNQVYGWGPDALNALGQLWHGTPGWAKAAASSTTGHGVEALVEP